jgi:hypothetical protein
VRPSAEGDDDRRDDQHGPAASSAPVQPAAESARPEGEQERDQRRFAGGDEDRSHPEGQYAAIRSRPVAMSHPSLDRIAESKLRTVSLSALRGHTPRGAGIEEKSTGKTSSAFVSRGSRSAAAATTVARWTSSSRPWWIETDAAQDLGDLAVKRKLELVGMSTAHILLATEKESKELRAKAEKECAELRSQARRRRVCEEGAREG